MGTVDKRELSRGFNSSSGSYELVVSPILLALLGRWLDGMAGSGPWFMVVGAVLGLAGATVKMYYTYQYKMAQHTAEARAVRDARDTRVAEAAS